MIFPDIDRRVQTPLHLQNSGSVARQTNPYRGHRFPAEIISYCMWLYYTLSFHDIEMMMLYRGITVSGTSLVTNGISMN